MMRSIRNSIPCLCAAICVLAAANPALAQLSLTTNADPAEGGSVAVFPNDGDFAVGQLVTVTANAAEGFKFFGWEGSITAEEGSVTFEMTDNTELTAVFIADPVTFKLNAFIDPSGAGTIVREPAAFDYDPGTEVTLTAFAGEGFVFSGWTGDVPDSQDANSDSITVTVDSDLDLQATFATGSTLVDGAGDSSSIGCGSVGMVSIGTMLSMMFATGRGRKRSLLR